MADKSKIAQSDTPAAPDAGELSRLELEQVVGGMDVSALQPRRITEANGVATDVSAAIMQPRRTG